MPRGDGTGPPAGGRGRGRGLGPGGECVCPVCGTSVPHQAGQPCYQVTCPKCGARTIRK